MSNKNFQALALLWAAVAALSIAFSAPASAQMQPQVIEIYPAAAASRVSPSYSMKVYKTNQWVDAPVYHSQRVPYPGYGASQAGRVNNFGTQGQIARASWATIGISHSARVRVQFIGTGTPSLSVLPDRYRLESRVLTVTNSMDTIEFSIKAGEKVYVQNGTSKTDTMFVFANPPEPQVGGQPCSVAWAPPYTPSDVLFYGPGETTAGLIDLKTMPAIRKVYLAPGAWVMGNIDAGIPGGTYPVEILGPGVLSGELTSHDFIRANASNYAVQTTAAMITSHSNWNAGYTTAPINLAKGMNHSVNINGPTLVAGPFYNVMLQHVRGGKTIANLHCINPWNYNSDGFQIGSNATITNCFVFNNDDTIFGEWICYTYPYLNGGTWTNEYRSVNVQNCVLAGRDPFRIGYGYAALPASMSAYATVDSCDVAFMLPQTSLTDAGVFNLAMHNPSGRPLADDGVTGTNGVRNQIYRDIRIHGPVERLFNLSNRVPGWSSGSDVGNSKDLVFENIRVVDPQSTPSWSSSVINGKNQFNKVGYCEFRNIVVNNTAAGGLDRMTESNWWMSSNFYFLSPANGWSSISWNIR